MALDDIREGLAGVEAMAARVELECEADTPEEGRNRAGHAVQCLEAIFDRPAVHDGQGTPAGEVM